MHLLASWVILNRLMLSVDIAQTISWVWVSTVLTGIVVGLVAHQRVRNQHKTPHFFIHSGTSAPSVDPETAHAAVLTDLTRQYARSSARAFVEGYDQARAQAAGHIRSEILPQLYALQHTLHPFLLQDSASEGAECLHILQSQVASLISQTEHILDTSAASPASQWVEWLQEWAAAQVAPPVSVSVTGCMHHPAVAPERVTALFRMLETLVRQAPRYCTGVILQVHHAGSHLTGWIEVPCADPRRAPRHPASEEAARYILQYGGSWNVTPPHKTTWSCSFILPCTSDMLELPCWT